MIKLKRKLLWHKHTKYRPIGLCNCSFKKCVYSYKNKFFKDRLYFIEGQLYNQMSKKDSANIAFQQVIKLNRNVPMAYKELMLFRTNT